MRTSRVVLAAVLLVGCAYTQQFTNTSPAQLFDKAMNAFSGSGANRNPYDGVTYLRSSAEKGYVPAQMALGYLADSGTYMARMPSDAAIWYRRAAEQGDVLAQWALGRQYLLGTGVARDLLAAERWLNPAASSGNAFAAYLLGLACMERSDYASAAKWLRKAAEQGLPQAQFRLGLLLYEGRGVATDRKEAYIWLLLAAGAGQTRAQPTLGLLEGDLGSATVDQLKTKARELQTTAIRSVNARGCSGWDGEFDDVPAVPPIELQKFCR